MDNELVFRAQFLQRQAEELEQNLVAIENELFDLQNTDKNLDFLSKSVENSSISTIGKGLHVRTNIESKQLFVEVGAGVVVKKSPEDARKIIETQMRKLIEARVHMAGKLEIYNKTIEGIMSEIEQEQKNVNSNNK